MSVSLIPMATKADKKLLRKLVRTYGEKGHVAEAANGVGVSKALLEQLMSDRYKATLRPKTVRKICSGFKVRERDLFPLVSAKGR